MPLWSKVTLSLLAVAAVLFFMWRLPRRGESFFGWAPALALTSTWAGLTAVVCAVVTWCVVQPDPWLAASFMFLDPAAMTTGIGVLWIYRRYGSPQPTISEQRLQAQIGIALGLVAVAIGYAYVFLHRQPDIPWAG